MVNKSTKAIQNWLKNPKEEAERLINYYGQPDEVSSSFLVWNTCAPWKRTILRNIEIPHNFPHPHTDYLEQYISYRVPPDMYDDLAEFDGSILLDRTAGEIGAPCGGTSMNFVAINLAHDIITGRKTVPDARHDYVHLYKAYQQGEKPLYTQSLSFKIAHETEDPDVEESL